MHQSKTDLKLVFTTRASFWLRCKKPLVCNHQRLVLKSLVVPFWKPRSEYLQLKDTSPLVFIHQPKKN